MRRWATQELAQADFGYERLTKRFMREEIPLCWLLLTILPVQTFQQAAQCVYCSSRTQLGSRNRRIARLPIEIVQILDLDEVEAAVCHSLE